VAGKEVHIKNIEVTVNFSWRKVCDRQTSWPTQ